MKRATTIICTPAHLCKNKTPKGGEVGTRYGRLVITEFLGLNSRRESVVKSICDCGTEFAVFLPSLRSGNTTSCGCLQKERVSFCNTTHGQSGENTTPEYGAWQWMLSRCRNKKADGWKNYGGRGITVCDRWQHSFENFLADMGLKPSPKHTLDRENNNGNYEPGNCRWAIPRIQHRNKRNNKWVFLNGAKMVARDAATILNTVPHNISAHIKKAKAKGVTSFVCKGRLVRICECGGHGVRAEA